MRSSNSTSRSPLEGLPSVIGPHVGTNVGVVRLVEMTGRAHPTCHTSFACFRRWRGSRFAGRASQRRHAILRRRSTRRVAMTASGSTRSPNAAHPDLSGVRFGARVHTAHRSQVLWRFSHLAHDRICSVHRQWTMSVGSERVPVSAACG